MTNPSCWNALKNLQKATPSDPVVSALLDINQRLERVQYQVHDKLHCSQDKPESLHQAVDIKKIRNIATRVKSLLDSYRQQTYSEMDSELREIYEDLNSLID
jgi:hypothetical protein